MTAITIQQITHYSPKSLINFYRATKQTPTVEIIKANCIRYEYDATEIHEICDAFGFDAYAYRKIRNEVYDSINPIALSINGKDRLKDDKRIQVAWDHIEQLHLRSNCYGNIIFASPRVKGNGTKSMWQYAVPKSKITKAMISKLLLIPNLYLMVNTSKSYLRRTDAVVSINALYLDIDNVTDVEGFIKQCKDEGRFDVLEPSKIVASGGGVHMYFYLQDAYAKDRLIPYISRAQKALHLIYPEADKLSDLVRLLRLDGSLYDKPDRVNKVVKTVYESERVYRVADIGPRLVDPYQPKQKRKKVDTIGKDKPFAIVPQGTWQELEIKRVRDLEYLHEIGHFNEDRRKRGVFFYALFVLRASGRFDVAAKMAYEFNAALKKPLSTEIVENQISSVKQNGFNYKYKRETLVGQLEIDKLTREQQEGLRAIMPQAIKYERQYAYKKKMRRNKKGLTTRKAAKEDNYNKVKTLLQQGLKQKDIASKLNITKGYVSQIVRQIRSKDKQNA